VFQSVLEVFKRKTKYHAIRTFTYYVPAPPNRKTGYQEKEFDQISDHLVEKNFDIMDIKMEAFASATTAGMWIICILGAKTKDAASMSLEIEYSDIAALKEQYIHTDPLIEHDH
jgi:hypothetical protein